MTPDFTDFHRENTAQRALAVSTDDGYSSGDNLDKLIESGVHVVSFSGSTGRKVLGEDIYATDACAHLRNERSAVESTIFTFKHKLHMRRFCRRGLSGVQTDLSAAVLAYNLWRVAFVRRARHRQQEQEDPLARCVA